MSSVNLNNPCYWKSRGDPNPQNSIDVLHLSPCGPVNSTNPVVSCCFPGETCLEDGICQFAPTSAGLSGYRVAACTDPTYKDPICKEWCASVDPTDVVYGVHTNLWSCCAIDVDTTGAHCNNITSANQDFQAPAASNLASLFIVPSGGFLYTSQGATSSSTSTRASQTSQASSTVASLSQSATSSSAPTSSSSASAEPSSGLSTGAAAGIGVGSGIAAILLVSVAVYLFRRSRRRAQQPPVAPEPAYGEQPNYYDPNMEAPKATTSPNHTYHTELSTQANVAELGTEYNAAELPAPNHYGYKN
ncbi:hypothetical protein GQ53DRAFT_805912 [Thozetella sp. PMI_491]|nr:hypothetical protein GQ53DRAFT_805912 [Thozetella sp. PMI_491]